MISEFLSCFSFYSAYGPMGKCWRGGLLFSSFSTFSKKLHDWNQRTLLKKADQLSFARAIKSFLQKFWVMAPRGNTEAFLKAFIPTLITNRQSTPMIVDMVFLFSWKCFGKPEEMFLFLKWGFSMLRPIIAEIYTDLVKFFPNYFLNTIHLLFQVYPSIFVFNIIQTRSSVILSAMYLLYFRSDKTVEGRCMKFILERIS